MVMIIKRMPVRVRKRIETDDLTDLLSCSPDNVFLVFGNVKNCGDISYITY